MGWDGYRRVWAIEAARRAILLANPIRIGIFGLGVALTLHIVLTLRGSYSAAGLASGMITLAIGFASPYRGRLLDRRGLRATLLPSLVVLPLAFVTLPFVPYWAVVALMLPIGAFSIPIFSVVRQVLVASVDESDRRSAISLDSVITELCFMAGPAIAAALAVWNSRLALLTFGFLSVAGAAALYVANPALKRADGEEAAAHASGWLTLRVGGILAAVFASGVILAGTDISVVAAMRSFGQAEAVGLVLAVWGLGSAIGGALHGALHRGVPLSWLTVALAAFTIPVALAGNAWTAGVLLFIAGLFCAPLLAASSDAIAAEVPATVLGEAMGWQGTMMMAGSSLAPPAIGWVIDHNSWQAGFITAGLAGLLFAAVLIVATAGRRRIARVR